MNQINTQNMIAQLLQFKMAQFLLVAAFAVLFFGAFNHTTYAAKPILQIESSSNYTGPLGASASLSWNSGSYNNCQISTDATNWNNVANNGSQNVNIGQHTTIYTLRCQKPGGGYITGAARAADGNTSGRAVLNQDVSQCPWTENASVGRYVFNIGSGLWSRGSGAPSAPNQDKWTYPASNGYKLLPAAMASDLDAEYVIKGHAYDQNNTGGRNDWPDLDGKSSGGQDQENEQFGIELLTSSLAINHKTGFSTDLNDSSSPQQWQGVLDSGYTIPSSVKYLRARISPGAQSTWSSGMDWQDDNSVDLGCVAFERVTPPPAASVDLTHTPEPSPAPGTNVTLDYDLEGGANNCTLSGGGVSQIGINTDGTKVVSPSVNTTYTITCDDGDGGTTQDTTSVTVTPSADPVVDLTATPNKIDSGKSAELTWSSSNVDVCSLEDGSGNVLSTATANASGIVVNPSTNTTYTLDCRNTSNGKTADDAETVTVTKTTHDVTIDINGDGSGDVGGDLSCSTDCTKQVPDGTDITLVPNPDPDSTFTGWSGDCTGTGNCVINDIDGPKNVTANFSENPPVVDLSLTNTSPTAPGTSGNAVDPGTSVSLTWDVTSGTADNCSVTAGGPDFSISGVSGGTDTVSPVVTTNYIVQCSNSGGSDSSQEVVYVKSADDYVATMTITADPTIVRKGKSTDLIIEMAEPMLSIPGNSCDVRKGDKVLANITGGSVTVSGGIATQTIDSGIVNSETEFTLFCSGVTDPDLLPTATVRVLPVIQES